MNTNIRGGLFFVLCSFVFLVNTTHVLAVETFPTIQAETVLAFTNAERYKVGRPFLTTNQTLSMVAREKMLDLFTRQYFAHESPSGQTVSDLAKKAGYKYILVGENLATGNFTSSKAVVDAWMNSPGHKKNILSETYSEIGIAAGRGIFEGRSTWMVVQTFGYPNSKCPQVDSKLEGKMTELDKKLTMYSTIAEMRKKLLSQKTGTLEERQARVDSYNVVARLYNSTIEKYSDLVEEYNKEVGKYNSCVKKIADSLE